MADIFNETDDPETDDKDQIAAEVIKHPASDWLKEQYLPFSMYAIRSRALVADDGLKPVNRRILYSLFKDGVTPNSEHLKAARAAANAVAFHPHGSSSVEDALARMAQNFSLRVPLIDPYGSVGFVTGDTPAAARYWEARLSSAAMELLKELPDGAVPIGKNFDGKLDEPYQLPVRWPNNIINGTQGIAVGYASNMFSHNPDEVMKAAIALLKNPDLTVDKLLKIMPGPDLPTGGELFEVDGVRDYYETGSGRFTVRGRYTIEQGTRGKVKIIFYELPYQVSAHSVLLKIREQQQKGRLKDIASVKDLTDKRNGLRLVIETKSGTNHLSIINNLFKYTPVETKFSVNSTVLVDNKPVQIGMIPLLEQFINFRRSCVLNKAQTRTGKIDARTHQLKAILAALIDIDKCISIIRNSDTLEIARKELTAFFKIDQEQADYILSMQLRRLTKADSISIQEELDALLTERNGIEKILTSADHLTLAVEAELRATLKVISDKRRTVISGMTSEEVKEIVKESAQEARDIDKNLTCYVTRFADGRLIKTDEPFTYSPKDRKWKNSPIVEQIKMKTKDDLLLIGSDGLARKIPLSYVAFDYVSKTSDVGVQFGSGVKLVAISKVVPLKSDVGLVLASRKGEVKLVRPEFPNKEEFVVFKLSEGDEVIAGRWLGKSLSGSSMVSVSSGSNVLVYDATTLRPTGAAAGGVISQRLKAGETVVGFDWVPSAKDNSAVIISQSKTSLKATQLTEIPPKSKGAQGVALHRLKSADDTLVKAAIGTKLVVGLAGANNTINLPPASKRAAAGVDFAMDILMGASEALTM
jgi:DNA gyrase subunit A